MANTLFVRDFAPQTDLADLENLFSEVGNVTGAVFDERETKGVLRKVAYIEMSSFEEVRDCIDRFHGQDEDGYIMTVTENKQHVPNPNFSAKKPAQITKAKSKPRAPSILPNKC